MKNRRQIGLLKKSVGKTKERNDDFVFAENISSNRALGVIGDFTSDSPAGINDACHHELTKYCNKHQSEWKRNLTDGVEIVRNVANHINRWLDESAPESHTTLIVVLHDAYEHKLYHTIQGDSGLAVATKDGIQYISKGDISGKRIGAGFLPITTNFQIHSKSLAPSDIILAYTDGLWENTDLHIEGDKRLFNIFSRDSLEEISSGIDQEIFAKSNNKDDLSIMVFKEQEMSGENQTNLDKLQYMVEDLKKKVELLNAEAPVEKYMAERMIEIEKQHVSFEKFSENIKKDFEALQNNTIEELKTKVKNIGREISNIDDRFKWIDYTVDELQSKLGSPEILINDLESQIGMLQGEIEKINNQFIRLSSTIRGLPSKTEPPDNGSSRIMPSDLEDQIRKYYPHKSLLRRLQMDEESFKWEIKNLYRILKKKRDVITGQNQDQQRIEIRIACRIRRPEVHMIDKEITQIMFSLQNSQPISVYYVSKIWLSLLLQVGLKEYDEKTQKKLKKKIHKLARKWKEVSKIENSSWKEQTTLAKNLTEYLSNNLSTLIGISTLVLITVSIAFLLVKSWSSINTLWGLLTSSQSSDYSQISETTIPNSQNQAAQDNQVQAEDKFEIKPDDEKGIWSIYDSTDEAEPVKLPDIFQKDSLWQANYEKRNSDEIKQLLKDKLEEITNSKNGSSVNKEKIEEVEDFEWQGEQIFTKDSIDILSKLVQNNDQQDPVVVNLLPIDDPPQSIGLNSVFEELGISRDVFLHELRCLKVALVGEKDKIAATPTTKGQNAKLLSFQDGCKIANRAEVTISVRGWMKEDDFPDTFIYKMWLQIRIGGVDIDGLTGKDTKKRFIEKFKKIDAPKDVYDSLIKTWPTPDSGN